MRRVKKRIFAVLIALALAGGTLAAVEPAGHAATTACGVNCAALASKLSGFRYVLAVSGGTPQVGQPVILSEAGQFNAEDFKTLDDGTVWDFYKVGIIGPAVALVFPSLEVYEYEYVPGGTPTALCLGTATAASQFAAVTLQQCGVNAHTIWIPLNIDNLGGYEPVMAATNTSLNTPYVLTSEGVGEQPNTQQLDLFDGTFNPAQMWTGLSGIL